MKTLKIIFLLYFFIFTNQCSRQSLLRVTSSQNIPDEMAVHVVKLSNKNYLPYNLSKKPAKKMQVSYILFTMIPGDKIKFHVSLCGPSDKTKQQNPNKEFFKKATVDTMYDLNSFLELCNSPNGKRHFLGDKEGHTAEEILMIYNQTQTSRVQKLCKGVISCTYQVIYGISVLAGIVAAIGAPLAGQWLEVEATSLVKTGAFILFGAVVFWLLAMILQDIDQDMEQDFFRKEKLKELMSLFLNISKDSDIEREIDLEKYLTNKKFYFTKVESKEFGKFINVLNKNLEWSKEQK